MITQHLITHIKAEAEVLDDLLRLHVACKKACKAANATILEVIEHKFEPQGCTILCLLSESHMSIHTWPERGTAAVDIFTCGAHTRPMEGLNTLLKELNATAQGCEVITRKV